MGKKYGVNDLRRMFLEYFEQKNDHLSMKSFSLVPHNDNSLLLINAGMAPLKPYFTGQEIPPKKRVTTCQKCIRTGDIDNVGKTDRHLTFFEMLGNFSFGDYFKKEALRWSWEFLTEVAGLDKDRLYPSVYMEDDEAYEIWTKDIGVDPSRITKFGKKADGSCDNFWEHGAGPCGPCSEIYFDRGEAYESGIIEDVENATGFLIGKDSERYIEVWNDVFTQFEGDGHGGYTTLKQKNIDTGMGLERLAVVVQDAESVFDIDTMRAIRDRICEIAGVKYKDDHQKDISIRVIVDHMRSSTFMISDGIMPSNEGRGYVLRRLIRRAIRHGRKLGIEKAFLAEMALTVIEGSKDGYPELAEKREFITRVLSEEESKFAQTLDQGLKILSDMTAACKEKNETKLSGEDAFRLYDTFGFPFDLTCDILSEQGMTADEEGFDKEMQAQRKKARESRKETNYMGEEATAYDEIDTKLTTTFTGYESGSCESVITALVEDEVRGKNGAAGKEVAPSQIAPKELTQALTDGQYGTIIVEKTPFYGTMGGQTGDVGVIVIAGDGTSDGDQGSSHTSDIASDQRGIDATANAVAVFRVLDTIHLKGGRIGHIGRMEKGMLKTGDKVTLTVDPATHAATCKNHSATHLLHKALRTVLGNHVEQAGSLVTPDRLRFDFSHFTAMTPDELSQVEEIVNREIAASLSVNTQEMTLEEAKKTGAMALFGEKYGDKVRVVQMGDFSTELCGGTHVANTAAIGSFKLVSENGIAAGVRRIEALTGDGVRHYYAHLEALIKETAGKLKTTPEGIAEKVAHLQTELKTVKSELDSMKAKQAQGAIGNAENEAVDVKGVKLIAKQIAGVDMNGLRDLGDSLKAKIAPGVVVLMSEADGKVNLIVMATDDAVKMGAHAGNLVKAIAPKVGGGGGGRPNMAQAGGKNPAGIADALKAAEEELATQIQ